MWKAWFQVLAVAALAASARPGWAGTAEGVARPGADPSDGLKSVLNDSPVWGQRGVEFPSQPAMETTLRGPGHRMLPGLLSAPRVLSGGGSAAAVESSGPRKGGAITSIGSQAPVSLWKSVPGRGHSGAAPDGSADNGSATGSEVRGEQVHAIPIPPAGLLFPLGAATAAWAARSLRRRRG